MGTLGRLTRLATRPSWRGPTPASPRGVGLLAVSVLLVGVPAMPSGGADRGVPRSPAQVEAAADRDMVIRIHLACRWQIPAGALAGQRAENPAVKTVGTTIHDDDVALDQESQTVSAQLGIALPNQPNDQQVDWLDQLSNANANDFDPLFVSLLRQADGSMLSVLAAVRAGTGNDAVRQLAEDAVTGTMKHMTLLEGTNLVNYSSLPPAPHPALDRVPFSQRPLPDVLFVWIVIAVAVLGGGVSIARIIRPQ